ncbi:MAG: agarase [Bacteroidales bacterium]
MRLMHVYFFLLLFSSVNLLSQVPGKSSEGGYIEVAAKRRITGSDGSVTYRDYELFRTRTVELLPGFKDQAGTVTNSRYGGRTDRKVKATGFYRVEKIGDRWWCVDPDGYLYLNIALNSISPGGSEKNKKALSEKFGSPEKWISETLEMLKENGFNCAGSWSDHKAIIAENMKSPTPFAYTVNLNFMSSYGKERGGTFQQPGHTGYPNDVIFVFDSEWEKFCDRHAKQATQYKDDPAFFGYFSDNEMPFRLKSLDNYLSLPAGDEGRIAAEKWLLEKGIKKEAIDDNIRSEFLYLVAEKYFSAVSKALKKYDPNHMYIGARFYSGERNIESFMRSAGRYLDIVSINYYNKWTPDASEMMKWTDWTGRPFIITEYYTKGEDSGMPNTSGAGWIVKTQRDRGLFYQNYNLALLQTKSCVGWHYFKYQDNDPTAKGVDPSNTDSNKGIVNNEFEVWKDFMLLIKELNTKAYNLIDHFDNESLKK